MATVAATQQEAQQSLFVFERADPTDASLVWLEEQAIRTTRGPGLWERTIKLGEREIIEAAQGYDAVMGASGARFSRTVLEALPELKVIAKFGIGVDTIDLAAARDLGIGVCNSPDDLAVTDVAEHAIALMLALMKNLSVWTREYLLAGGWRPGHVARSLDGATVGIIGLGRIGRATAERLRGWNARLIAYDPVVTDPPPNVEMCDLATLLDASDIVTLHAAPTPDNHHLIGAAAFAAMKRDSILINCGRASLVDSGALVDALRTGRIAGAAIDVFDQEPPPADSPLLQLPNLIATPHVASWTTRSMQNVGWRCARGAHALLRGLPWDHVVCPAGRVADHAADRSSNL